MVQGQGFGLLHVMANSGEGVGDANPLPTHDATAMLAEHWGKVYENNATARTREWHCEYHDVQGFIARFCESASHPEGTVLDVGCGGSCFGERVLGDFGLGHLFLTDIDPGIVEILKARYETALHEGAPKSVTCEVMDCTDMKSIASNSCAVVLDKGTLDALHGEKDKMRMLLECGRVLAASGVFVSVSFASAKRVPVLMEAAKRMRLQLRIKVLGQGDPRFGHTVYFVAVLGKDLGTAGTGTGCWGTGSGMDFDNDDLAYASEDELTQTVLTRVHRASSVIEYDPPSKEDELTLFDESDGEYP